MMLRITVHDESDSLTLHFEGGLVGPWVQEAEHCWNRTLASQPRPDIRLDLTGVTFIDAAGKAFLAEAHTHGSRLIASGCMMRAVVAELTNSPIPRRGCPFGQKDFSNPVDSPAGRSTN
jgi:hypothetical protein